MTARALTARALTTARHSVRPLRSRAGTPLLAVALLQTGCTVLLPATAPGERSELRSPYQSIEPGARVILDMKDNSEVHGTHTGTVEQPDSTYRLRFKQAVLRDSTLHSVPVPGDSVRVTVDSARPETTDGIFVGLGDGQWPGIYLDRMNPPLRLIIASRIVAFERIDGPSVDYQALQEATLSGRIPSYRERTIRKIRIRTEAGAMEVDAREVDQVTVIRKGRKGWALLIGMAIDTAVLVLARSLGDSLIDIDLGDGSF